MPALIPSPRHTQRRPGAVERTLGLARALALAFPLLAISGSAQAQDPSLRFGARVPQEVVTIYDRGLAWLAAQQGPDGDWRDNNRGAGVTGICLMAFLASGEDPNHGKYAKPIRLAVRSILTRQDASSGYYPESMYHHGFAMLALSEAYGVIDERSLWEGAKPVRSIAHSLELAIRLAGDSQKRNDFGGWRYSPESRDADTSVTGAMLMGLLAARNAGMDVPDTTVNNAMQYIRRSTGTSGMVAYSGGLGEGLGGSMNLTAIGTLVGAVSRSKESDEYKAAKGRLLDHLEHRESSYPEYFGYYMAQALFQADYPAWQKWNQNRIRELLQQQRPDGSFKNSPYSTGMSLLALGLNYRLLPIYER